MCRFKLMKDNGYPDFLIKTESLLLSSRMKKLSAEEVEYLNLNFNQYYKEYLIDSEIEDVVINESINKEMMKLN